MFGQVQFGACYSLISLKQPDSEQTSRKPIDFVTEAAFCGAALMDAFQAYSFISSKSGIIFLQRETDSAAVTSHCDHAVSVFQCRPSPVIPSKTFHIMYVFLYFLNQVPVCKIR